MVVRSFSVMTFAGGDAALEDFAAGLQPATTLATSATQVSIGKEFMVLNLFWVRPQARANATLEFSPRAAQLPGKLGLAKPAHEQLPRVFSNGQR